LPQLSQLKNDEKKKNQNDNESQNIESRDDDSHYNTESQNIIKSKNDESENITQINNYNKNRGKLKFEKRRFKLVSDYQSYFRFKILLADKNYLNFAFNPLDEKFHFNYENSNLKDILVFKPISANIRNIFNSNNSSLSISVVASNKIDSNDQNFSVATKNEIDSENKLNSAKSTKVSNNNKCILHDSNKYQILFKDELEHATSLIIYQKLNNEKDLFFEIYHFELKKRFLFGQMDSIIKRAETDAIMLTTKNDQNLTILLEDYCWKPFEKYVELHSNQKDLKKYNYENFYAV